MKKAFWILDYLLSYFNFLILLLMTIIVASNVFGRFVLGVSISWGEEVAKMLLTYLTFFGAAMAMQDNSHYSFDFLKRKMPEKTARHLTALRWVIIIVFTLVIIRYSTEITFRMKDWIMPTTGINKAFVYMATPLGLLFLLFYSLRNFLYSINEAQKSKDIGEGGNK